MNEDYFKKIDRKHLGLRTIPHPASTGYTYTLIFNIIAPCRKRLRTFSPAGKAVYRPFLCPRLLTGFQKPEEGWKQAEKI
ncbi:MAG: hypothetical protein ABS46_06850 [Cytophagaceae bacterium SCN 52-12]|nr:MAG: hypothetical protein ABS46_06850 [Cytophagaceae bacterium SCN 52-12]